MAYFDDSSHGYSATTSIEYKQTGDTEDPILISDDSTSARFVYASAKVNGKTLTASFTSTYS